MPTGPSHELSALVSRRLQNEYETVRAKVHRQVDGLTDDQLWRRPFPYGNSWGTSGILVRRLLRDLTHAAYARKVARKP